jgi:hypothetical protein
MGEEKTSGEPHTRIGHTVTYNSLFGKVIHIGAEVHANVKGFCEKRNLSMRSFTEEALDRAMLMTEEERYRAQSRKNKK